MHCLYPKKYSDIIKTYKISFINFVNLRMIQKLIAYENFQDLRANSHLI